MQLADLKGVGPRLAGRLERIGITSPGDLLFHLPLRYQDRATVYPIGRLRPGMEAVVVAAIHSCRINFGKRRSLLTEIRDASGGIIVRMFHFSRAQQRGIENADWIRCFGEVSRGPRGLELVHPEYRLFNEEPVQEEDVERRLTPVYPSTEGLGQKTIRQLIDQVIDRVDDLVVELLPDEVLRPYRFPTLADALRELHAPAADTDRDVLMSDDFPPRRRLGFEELIAHHLAAGRSRAMRQSQSAEMIAPSSIYWPQLKASLGFELTSAQHRAVDEIRADLAKCEPAHRLVQGDVGSGKTLVAAAACLDAIESGGQAALMAPTEILAEQHLASFIKWFQPLGIHVAALLGRQGAKERREVLASVNGGITQMIVGTHALFQDSVEFHNLQLIVVDEQHRFGVMQRFQLREKGRMGNRLPHQITMTATPIPRSLAMSIYADMDVTSIDELPPGRTPVETLVVPESRRDDVLERIREATARGEQVYWVCPLIDESETLEAQAATDIANQLQQQLSGVNIALVHGRLRAADKEAVMQRFRSGEVQLLVATTVIEVGVDVPNASLMVIENAERLGLAQLHQLRGRVGRGARKSYCVLLYRAPLGQVAKQRLAIMRQSNDGFEIAAKDLEIRGPGELMGTRQTGMQRMMIADLVRDQAMLPAVRKAATQLVEKHPEVCDALIHRWIKTELELVNV